MSVQTNYRFFPTRGVAGGIYDLTPHAINTFLNEEATGDMHFGLGVVAGTTAGTQIALPTSTATAAEFEGITVNGRTNEHDLEGNIHIRENEAIGVMRYGKIFACVVPDQAPSYGDPVYLITDGAYAGYFAKTLEVEDDTNYTGFQIPGKFAGNYDAGAHIAVVELFNATVAGAVANGMNMADINDVNLTTPATNGQVLKYDGTSKTWKPGADATT